ncbi:MAG: hypothetical protein HYZ90_03830 [Candidatus Omnitrophica bacterium]|nr:hypothetical protein [Candidatus Omnitrophota bacterium]
MPPLDRPGPWDYLISYLSPWIIPREILERSLVAAINFHPGPPEYPGIGCTNFALYEGAARYGVTCHHMLPRVDAGPIVRAVRFPLTGSDSVASLTYRSYAVMAALFYEIADRILAGEPLPQSQERWTRRPFRRSELNALCRLESGMSEEEIRRRVRATTFSGHPGASLSEAGLALEMTGAPRGADLER